MEVASPPAKFDAYTRRALSAARAEWRVARPAHAPHVVGVEFGMLSEVELRRLAAVFVHEPPATLVTEAGAAESGSHEYALGRPNSVMDARMGSPDVRRFPCSTCGWKLVCPGHLGAIVLPFPVYSETHFRATLTALQLLCYHCARAWPAPGALCRLVELNETCPVGDTRTARMRATAVRKLAATRRRGRACQHCGLPQPIYTAVRRKLAITAAWTSKDRARVSSVFRAHPIEAARVLADMAVPFNSARARAILAAAPVTDSAVAGFSTAHIESWLPAVVPVLGLPQRPGGATLRPDTSSDSRAITTRFRLISRTAEALFARIAERGLLPGAPRAAATPSASAAMLLIQGGAAGGAGGGAARGRRAPHALVAAALDAVRSAYGAEVMASALADATCAEAQRVIQEAYNVSICNGGEHHVAVEKTHSGKPELSLRALLAGKEGLIRLLGEGKRVKWTLRATISGDAGLLADEIGISETIIHRLTLLEAARDTPGFSNLAVLRAAIVTGPGMPRGATHLVTVEGLEVDIKDHAPDVEARRALAEVLRPGWRVRRVLTDGDIVFANRAPSLHKPSIMAHRVRVVAGGGDVVFLNLAQTTPYNADFDGDAMTIHVPQTPASTAEAAGLLGVYHNGLISAATNSPGMGVVQDTATAAFLITSARLSRTLFMHVIGAAARAGADTTLPPPGFPNGDFTGGQVFDVLLRGTRAYHVRVAGGDAAVMTRSDLRAAESAGCLTRFRNGTYECGPVTRADIAGLIHAIALMHGVCAAGAFLSRLQLALHAWFTVRGYAMGATDLAAAPSTARVVAREIAAAEAALEALGAPAPREAGPRAAARIMRVMNDNVTARVVAAATSERRAMLAMIESGAKGSVACLKHLMGCVGPQAPGAVNELAAGAPRRLLSCFEHGDGCLAALGHVAGAYAAPGGLNAAEFITTSVDQRRCLVDKCVAVGQVGEALRRLTKMMDSCVVAAGGAVFSAQDVVQARAGGDGWEAARLMRVTITAPLAASDSVWRHACGADTRATAATLRWRDAARATLHGGGVLYGAPPAFALLPCAVYLLLEMDAGVAAAWDAVSADDACAQDVRTAAPGDVIDVITASMYTAVVPHCGAAATSVLAMHMAWELLGRALPHRVLVATVAAAAWSAERAVAPPGEAIGIIAAQSVGHPVMQLMLNAPHAALAGRASAARGMPAFLDLLNGRPARKCKLPPVMRLALRAPATPRQLGALISTPLRSVIHMERAYVVEEPVSNGVPDDARDAVLLRAATASYGSEAEAWTAAGVKPSRYVVRLELDRAACATRGITPRAISRTIARHRGGGVPAAAVCTILFSAESAPTWVVRVRPSATTASRARPAASLGSVADATPAASAAAAQAVLDADTAVAEELKDYVMTSVTLGGIDGVSDASASEERVVTLGLHGALTPHTAHFVTTTGSAFMAAARFDWVDWYKSTSTNLTEVIGALGHGAARAVMMQQLLGVVAAAESYVDARHLLLLVDACFARGAFTPVTRSGLTAGNAVGPLQRASFQNSLHVFTEAAELGTVDELGPLAAMFVSERSCVGTGAFGLLPPTSGPAAERYANAIAGQLTLEKSSDAFGHLLSETVSTRTKRSANELSSAVLSRKRRRVEWADEPCVLAGVVSAPCSSPTFTPSLPTYAPSSPVHAPSALQFVPSSPTYAPSSPAYAPSSPAYAPSLPAYAPSSPAHAPSPLPSGIPQLATPCHDTYAARRRIVDHTGTWRAVADVLVVPPQQWMEGKWIVRRAELVVADQRRVSVLDMRSIDADTRPAAHDPTYRGARVVFP